MIGGVLLITRPPFLFHDHVQSVKNMTHLTTDMTFTGTQVHIA